MIERHRDVGAEHPLDLRGALRREGATAAVHVALKLHAVVVHPAESLEREHLEATRIGEQRTIPTHEAMQGSELLDHLLAGPHMQVVGIREHQRRAYLQIGRAHVNSSHQIISYAVFCLKKKKLKKTITNNRHNNKRTHLQ